MLAIFLTGEKKKICKFVFLLLLSFDLTPVALTPNLNVRSIFQTLPNSTKLSPLVAWWKHEKIQTNLG